MTLREKLQATADFHAGTNWMLYLSQLENILAETADDDAERDRKARIGELVEKMHIVAIVAVRGQRAMVGAYSSDCMTFPQADWYAEGDTLLDALEALKAKATGGTDER